MKNKYKVGVPLPPRDPPPPLLPISRPHSLKKRKRSPLHQCNLLVGPIKRWQGWRGVPPQGTHLQGCHLSATKIKTEKKATLLSLSRPHYWRNWKRIEMGKFPPCPTTSGYFMLYGN